MCDCQRRRYTNLGKSSIATQPRWRREFCCCTALLSKRWCKFGSWVKDARRTRVNFPTCASKRTHFLLKGGAGVHGRAGGPYRVNFSGSTRFLSSSLVLKLFVHLFFCIFFRYPICFYYVKRSCTNVQILFSTQWHSPIFMKNQWPQQSK